MCANVYNTTVNINGRPIFSSRFSPFCCGPMLPPPPPISCFGFGFNFGCWGPRSFEAGLGIGVGVAAGAALITALPKICKGIGSLFHKKS